MLVNIVRIEENWERDRNVETKDNFIYALA